MNNWNCNFCWKWQFLLSELLQGIIGYRRECHAYPSWSIKKIGCSRHLKCQRLPPSLSWTGETLTPPVVKHGIDMSDFKWIVLISVSSLSIIEHIHLMGPKAGISKLLFLLSPNHCINLVHGYNIKYAYSVHFPGFVTPKSVVFVMLVLLAHLYLPSPKRDLNE